MGTMLACLILVAATAPAAPPEVEPAHARNPVYRGVLNDGLSLASTTVALPPPRLRDGEGADAQRAALRAVAGSDRAAAELVRDSVTAPFLLKVRDDKAGDSFIRSVDLWFVVYADLAAIQPDEAAAKSNDQVAEAGNMRFASHFLSDQDLAARKLPAPTPAAARDSYYVHLSGQLLDRIAVEVTNHVTVSRSDESLVVASRTDPAFERDDRFPNRWSPLLRPGESTPAGQARPYVGGISYAKISRLTAEPGALLVELHAAFVEPFDWFRGAAILRSKFSLIAQDQIRQLRRELTRDRRRE